MIENVTGDGVGLLILDPITHAYDILNHWSWECRWVLSSASKYGRVVCVHFSPVPSLFYRCSPSLPANPSFPPSFLSRVLYVIGYSVTVLHRSLADEFCTQNYKIYITG